MLALWPDDLETLETITRDADARRLLLRLAEVSQRGGTRSLVHEIAHDRELDETTRMRLTELALDRRFLLAVADYLVRTQRMH